LIKRCVGDARVDAAKALRRLAGDDDSGLRWERIDNDNDDASDDDDDNRKKKPKIRMSLSKKQSIY